MTEIMEVNKSDIGCGFFLAWAKKRPKPNQTDRIQTAAIQPKYMFRPFGSKFYQPKWFGFIKFIIYTNNINIYYI